MEELIKEIFNFLDEKRYPLEINIGYDKNKNLYYVQDADNYWEGKSVLECLTDYNDYLTCKHSWL